MRMLARIGPWVVAAMVVSASAGRQDGGDAVEPRPEPVEPAPVEPEGVTPAPAPSDEPAPAGDDGGERGGADGGEGADIGPAGGEAATLEAEGVADPSAQNQVLVDEMTPELDAAVTAGLARLAEYQQEDGSFGSAADRYGKNVAVAALASLAFMADGNLPGRGTYGPQVERSLEFILGSIAETGLIAADTSHGPMYGHGFATLFLGEVYGMTAGGPDTAQGERVHDALVRATRLIVQSQNEEGGWRYNPVPHDADVSVTICEVMGLRSARNAGIEVPKETIDRAVEYVKLCQNNDGGFRYQSRPGSSEWPRSAAGIASLYYSGVYEDEALERGLTYLDGRAFPGAATGRPSTHYFYGYYYSIQAVYLAGGDHWARWWPAMRDELIERQREDGSWEDANVGDAYGTAMALIILQMPKRYLPIFQR